MTKARIAFICGSIRKDSFHRRLGLAIAAATRDRLDISEVAIGDLALYDQDLEGDGAPAAWSRFRDQIRAVDAVLFGTPEYNRSVSGALKNALDVGSRPYGKNVFAHKPAAIFSATPGSTGAFGSNHHLRQICVALDLPMMAQPEAYWGGINDDRIGADGTITDPALAKVVVPFATAFADWVDLVRHGQSRRAGDAASSGGS